MNDNPKQLKLALVPSRDKQAREANSHDVQASIALRRRWQFAEASVWSDRMLTALENGVKGNAWFSLIDKVYRPENLLAAWNKVHSNGGAAGVDHVTVKMFAGQSGELLKKLHEQLRAGTYQPKTILRKYIPKPGSNQKRPLGIPTVADRIVQGAVRNVLEPIFEKEFAEHSYGFRPGRGCKDALRRVDHLLKQGYRYVVDADLKGYFDTIPHDKLMTMVRERVTDGRMLKLVESFLKAGVMEDLKEYKPTAGAPQGAVLSPLLSNIYLNPLDHLMQKAGFEMIRYADDLVVLCRTESEAQDAMARLTAWVEQAGLTLHPEKTKVVHAESEGFDFLGYRFHKGNRYVRHKSLMKLHDTIRAKTRRNSGRALEATIADVNRTVKGWFVYFKHAHKSTFESVDGWIRMRLRSILRNQNRKRGRGRGRDHQRWPNAYFAARGFYSLQKAHALACQSATRR